MWSFWGGNPLDLASVRPPSYGNPSPSQGQWTAHFGQSVLFHSTAEGGRHLTNEQLQAYRNIGDPPLDDLLLVAEKEGNTILSYQDIFDVASTPPKGRTHETIRDFMQNYEQLPSWVDVAQLERGRQVYLAYTPAIGLALYYRSLVPGFSIPKIAAVLSATKYLAPPSTREQVTNRLMDTGAFLCASMTEDILPGGQGWRTALQVRLLHAKVRRRLLRSSRWDVINLGVPINQEDMAATLLAFSLNSLLGIEIILGRPISLRERQDFLALWRYLGWLLGISVVNDDSNLNVITNESTLRPLDPCGPGWDPSKPNPWDHSCAMFQSIILHLLHPNELSRTISHHLLQMGTPKDSAPTATTTNDGSKHHDNWFYFRALRCRQYIGDPLADALHLPYHPTFWGLVRMRLFSMVYTGIITVYTALALPYSPFRRLLIGYHRRIMQRYFTRWQESHLQRMQSQLGQSRACPFSMVQPPSL